MPKEHTTPSADDKHDWLAAVTHSGFEGSLIEFSEGRAQEKVADETIGSINFFYQPEDVVKAGIYSFDVYRNKAIAVALHPGQNIVGFRKEDIEKPRILDGSEHIEKHFPAILDACVFARDALSDISNCEMVGHALASLEKVISNFARDIQ